MRDRWFDGTFHKREITINYMDSNTEKKVFIHKLMGIFSEIAGDECFTKGQTYEFFFEHGTVFLVTRMSIRLHQIPVSNDTVIITTWFRNTEGKFFSRDFDIRTEDGQLMASASGTWVLVDPFEHKTLELDAYPGVRSESFPDKAADSPDCKKIVSDSPLPVIGYRPVYYSDLDCNDHVNNSIYTKIAVDFLPPRYQRLDVFDYIVNFTRETNLGDTLEIRGGETENGYIIQGFCNNVQHFASEFVFRS